MLRCSSVVVALMACQPAASNQESASSTRVIRDDFGDTVAMSVTPPARVVSLNPATTAMLFAMGDGSRVVGRTRWDNYPPAVTAVPNVGDGLRPNIEAVMAQRPDLVVLYASGDDRPAAQAFRRAGITTVSMRVDRVADFARALDVLGVVMHDSTSAAHVRDSVLATIDRVHQRTASLRKPTVVWLLDASPLLVIGGGSYLNTLLADAGAQNLYAVVSDPAPQVSLEDVLRRDPDAVITSPPTARAMQGDPRWKSWFSTAGHRVLTPDSALVGMPSVRMGEAAVQLAALLHPTEVR